MKLPLKSTASWIQQSGKNAYRILSSSTRASSPSLSLIEKQKTFLQNSTRRNYACNGGGGCGGNGSCRKQSSSGDHPDKPTHSHSFGEYTSNVQECASTEMVNIYLNGFPIRVPKGSTILEAQLFFNDMITKTNGVIDEKAKVDIPTLCYHPRLKEHSPANCRICLVEEEINPHDIEEQIRRTGRHMYPQTDNQTKLVPSCVNKVKEGGCYWTQTQKTYDNAKSVLKFMLSHHNLDCPSCSANNMCEFQNLLEKYHVSKKDIPPSLRDFYTDTSEEFKKVSNIGTPDYLTEGPIQIDPDKCIRCTRCIRTCNFIQDREALSMSGRGHNEQVQQLNLILSEVSNFTEGRSPCIACGQCSQICPVGAITIKAQLDEVADLLMQKKHTSAFVGKEKDYVMVASTAPAVRVAISEEFSKEPGYYTSAQLVQGLRKLGFDYVFDTLFSADLTIMEEGTELIGRLTSNPPGPFPMYTSCCPGWVNLVEKDFPEIIPNVSSCKSPQQMLGAVVRKYWTPRMQHVLKGKKVIHVSIMPCTAKKGEAQRPEMGHKDAQGNFIPDIDYVLTTRELGKLFKMNQINDLDETTVGKESPAYDSPIAEGTGAAVIFGVTGGVMEAALRTAYEILEKKPLPKLNLEEVRGLDGIRSATIKILGQDIRVAVAHGSGNLKKLVEYTKTLKPEEQYHFIEMMACPSGCVGGGGEPKVVEKLEHQDIIKRRLQSIYKLDEASVIRKSHDNKEVQQLYKEFYHEPCSEEAHHDLHTHYHSRKLYKFTNENKEQFAVISNELVKNKLDIGSSFEIKSSITVDSGSKKVPCSFAIIEDLTILQFQFIDETPLEQEEENQIFDWIEACLFIYKAHQIIVGIAHKEKLKANMPRIARNMRVDKKQLQEAFRRFTGSKLTAKAMKTFCNYMTLSKTIIIQKELSSQKTMQELDQFREALARSSFKEHLVCVSLFTVSSLTNKVPIVEVMAENLEIADQIEQQFREIVETGQVRVGVEEKQDMMTLLKNSVSITSVGP
ncbi:hypothetical protein FDP41_001987 [Naegleria fowleri]|uniref:Uncharacterized protein n=1 Tax=Naegleria fowleri TaxID=5763 RepID=A0A6A5BPA2_NAEFO|nr:uncharacterized protein FDP41_001987 [Naegleria fowleri]KAF0978917.1 hypothetical protein FDP41_001987 [Naegleria fowleri]